MFGTPHYMAPEQIEEYDIFVDGEDAIFQDGLDPDAETCSNCGHVHLLNGVSREAAEPGGEGFSAGPRWVPIVEGACAPEREENDDAVV